MGYVVLRPFKCRKNEFKKYKWNEAYEHKDDAHTQMLIAKGFVKEVPKAAEEKETAKAEKTNEEKKKKADEK